MRTRLRTRRASGIPCSPLDEEGETLMQNSREMRDENAGVYAKSEQRHCERSEAIHSCFLVASWIALRSQ
jgi:hypothetical protein